MAVIQNSDIGTNSYNNLSDFLDY